MAYLYLLLSAVCSLIIAHLLKLTEVKQARTLNTLTVNYLIAFIVAFGVGAGDANGSGLFLINYMFLFCMIIGAFFIGNFVVYGKSVHINGIGVSVSAMRLSLVIPVLISILLYGEKLGYLKALGILMVLGALILLIPKQTHIKIKNINASWLLLSTFLLTGFADASLKIYHESFSAQLNEANFMGYVFVAAFLIGLGICLYRKGPLVSRKEMLLGACIGIPNLYSSIFLIDALNGIKGAVAFPIVNTMNVLGGTLLGLLVWKDKVTSRQWLGIFVAVTAILLLVI